MTEVLFYELDRQPLATALAALLEKSLERSWRAVVQATSRERVEALDSDLWIFRDEAFLPHGTKWSGHAERQPIYLTIDQENPNGAAIRFFVDGAACSDLEAYNRAVFLFDGRDEDDRARARERWREAQEAGHQVTYWKQSEHGRWQRQA